MPTLRRFAEQGASGNLRSTIPAITPPAWGGFQTGVNPWRYGIYDFFQWDRHSHQSHVVNSTHLKHTLWDTLSRHHKRHAVINLPMTYPPRAIEGYMVTGILTPSLAAEFTWPSSLKEELLNAVPAYQILNLKKAAEGFSDKSFESYVRHMADLLRIRMEAACYLMKKEPLDVVMLQFQETDALQHVLWGFMDPDHPLYDEKKRSYIFEHFYGKLDQAIGELHGAFGADGSRDFATWIVSDHGFQAHRKCFYLNAWLAANGYLKAYDPVKEPPAIKRLTKALKIGKMLQYILPKDKMTQIEKKVLNADADQFKWSETQAHVNWPRSRVFSRAGYCEGMVYILRQGPAGEKLAAELTENLLRISDPETGQPVVKSVLRRQDICGDCDDDRLPDLIIIPHDGYSFNGAFRKGQELLEVIKPTNIHVGMHHPDGIFVAYDPASIRPQTMSAGLLDIMPTILYYLGLAPLQKLDGRILTELFTDTFNKTSRPPAEAEPVQPESAQEGRSMNADDEKLVQDRLKDLGYL